MAWNKGDRVVVLQAYGTYLNACHEYGIIMGPCIEKYNVGNYIIDIGFTILPSVEPERIVAEEDFIARQRKMLDKKYIK